MKSSLLSIVLVESHTVFSPIFSIVVAPIEGNCGMADDTSMLIFIAQNMEITEVELRSANLPITQASAECLAKKLWQGSKRQRRNRKIDGLFKGKQSL